MTAEIARRRLGRGGSQAGPDPTERDGDLHVVPLDGAAGKSASHSPPLLDSTGTGAEESGAASRERATDGPAEDRPAAGENPGTTSRLADSYVMGVTERQRYLTVDWKLLKVGAFAREVREGV
ncbi:MAG: hypothetical protein ACRD19_14780 [Terriglobia bacterium]